MILFGCKMNWLSLTCNLKWDVVEICQKYLTVVVKNHENAEKPHLLGQISEINHKFSA